MKKTNEQKQVMEVGDIVILSKEYYHTMHMDPSTITYTIEDVFQNKKLALLDDGNFYSLNWLCIVTKCKKNAKYCSRKFLNDKNSPSSGSVIAYDGISLSSSKEVRNIYLRLSDCYVSATLYKTEDDTIMDFLSKMKLLNKEIELFIAHLNKEILKNK
jgi:hypothetical protein